MLLAENVLDREGQLLVRIHNRFDCGLLERFNPRKRSQVWRRSMRRIHGSVNEQPVAKNVKQSHLAYELD